MRNNTTIPVENSSAAEVSMLLDILLVLHLQVLAIASSSSAEEDESSERDAQRSKGSSHQNHWGYHDQDAWLSAFEHCSGKAQSPINIDTHKVFYEPNLPPIKLEGYDLAGSPALTLINNGHTLQLSLPSSMRIMRGCDHVYVAAQLHFHWGTTEVPGSEHTIDHVHFPAEIHVVHYNSRYANLAEAASKADGLAVLGGFIGIGLHDNDNYEKILSALTDISIEESDTEIPGFNVRHLLPDSLDRFYRYSGSLTTPPCFQTVSWTLFNDSIRVSRRQIGLHDNDNYEKILSALTDISIEESDTEIPGFNVRHLLPDSLDRFYRYSGSLTTPPCFQTVSWTLFNDSIRVSRRQLAALEDTLKTEHNKLLSKNFRAPQLLHGRNVLASFHTGSTARIASEAPPSETQDSNIMESNGHILAIIFGVLFAVTLLIFSVYTYGQRKKYSKFKKDSKQNVIYKPAAVEKDIDQTSVTVS
ncbi:carbonic anhydrase 9-like [Sinocyclocheilus anshuiensis]|uniref:carbonic anhydrase 9-like n=1 Tax=Sinocyclocheilus anshuiensis TaxID=1608454 RepID=UPI0007B89298|nr:PREDICTED: carbonic anhydrase 9-like [Sinocyclocheilus anshuiensis]